MSKLQRLVIHCTATPEGRRVVGDDIRAWHLSPVSKGGRGWKQVGYSYLIHLDGTMEQLVANNDDENVDPWEITNGAVGYNGTSMHIVYAGGVDLKSGKPKDTRTPAQREALERFVRNFHAKHPSAEIVGHNQLAAKACPSFDVPAWLCKIGL